MTRRARFVLVFLAAIAAAGCDKGATAGGGEKKEASLYAQSDSPDNLKGLLDTVVKAGEAGDEKKAAALTRGLIPDEAALKKAVRDDAPASFMAEAKGFAASVPPDDATVAGLFKRGNPARTEIQVHGATTEEIAKYESGSVAYAEFPGGAQKLAKAVLRPGVKFYEVEFVEPGQDSGMKYHLFYWDGSSWRMLGPAWRWGKLE